MHSNLNHTIQLEHELRRGSVVQQSRHELFCRKGTFEPKKKDEDSIDNNQLDIVGRHAKMSDFLDCKF